MTCGGTVGPGIKEGYGRVDGFLAGWKVTVVLSIGSQVCFLSWPQPLRPIRNWR